MKTKPLAVEHFHQARQGGIIQDALARLRGVEVPPVNHPCQLGVLSGDGSHGVGEPFPQLVDVGSYLCPTTAGWDVEADEGAIIPCQGFNDAALHAQLSSQSLDLIVVDIAEAFVEEER